MLSYPLWRAEGYLETAERCRAVSGIKALWLSEVELWPCGKFAGGQKVLRAAQRGWEGMMEAPEDGAFVPSPPFLPAVTPLRYSHHLHGHHFLGAKERGSGDPTPPKPCNHPPQAGPNVLGSLPLFHLFLVPPVEHPRGWQCSDQSPFPLFCSWRKPLEQQIAVAAVLLPAWLRHSFGICLREALMLCSPR